MEREADGLSNKWAATLYEKELLALEGELKEWQEEDSSSLQVRRR